MKFHFPLYKYFPGHRIFNFFIPVLLWGDTLDADAGNVKRYTPTKAQLRIQEQERLNAERISRIRQQQNAHPQNPSVSGMQVQTAVPTKKVPIRYIWHKKIRFVLLADVARYYGMNISVGSNSILMKSKRDSIQMLYEKRIVRINDTNMYLTHAPLVCNSMVYLDEKDFFLVIDPVIRNTPLWKHKVRTIMIDAGHGGKDRGAPGTAGLAEKNINLAIARKLEGRLTKMGYRVLMTRRTDTQLSLQQRADLCEKYKPDLLISIHCNAVTNKNIKGVETFAMTPLNAASTSDSKPGGKSGPGNSFDKNNYRLAYEIQKNLVPLTASEDRGVKHARFFVLRNATCPSVLVETGFITHPKEGLQLSRSAYQDKITTGIVLGISNYMRIVKPPVPPANVEKKSKQK